MTRSGRHDLALTLLALLALLAWDASGADLALTHLVATPAGFPWRDAWLTRSLLHDGGRGLAWAVMAGVLYALWRPGPTGPRRAERGWWLGVVVFSLLLVPALKRLSSTSCPWDLAEFGGVAHYVSHWHFGLADGGPGGCFPSGHAVSAFAFFGMYFLWRGHDAARARRWLAGTLAVGAVYGVAQGLRGAHYASHSLWSAWLCWTVAVLAARLRVRRSAHAVISGLAA